MFLHLIFRKLGLKENKYLMAGIYGAFYSVISFILLFFSLFYLRRLNLGHVFLFSLFSGIVMFIVYLIRWEVIKAQFTLKKAKKSQKSQKYKKKI